MSIGIPAAIRYNSYSARLSWTKNSGDCSLCHARLPQRAPVSLTSFHTYRADDTGAAFQGHIAHLRTSKQHMLLVDALLVRAMIAVHENACRAAMKDLDEAIALAQVLPDPAPN